MAGQVAVREATAEETTTARSILNAAMLAVDAATVEQRDVLVALEDGRVLGALVLDGREIDAVAVRPGRRGQGVGTALVEAAAARRDGDLVAAFDPGVRPFYESLGFDIERVDDGDEVGEDRCRGTLR